MNLKLIINKIELNNKSWFRRAVRWLGGKLVPNFSVEELIVVVPSDSGNHRTYHIIGESFDEYILINNSTVKKDYVDEYGKLVKTLYKNVNTCTLNCKDKAFKVDSISFSKDVFTVVNKGNVELVLDLFEHDVEEYLSFGNVFVHGTNGVYNVSATFLDTETSKYNKIKEKYKDELYT